MVTVYGRFPGVITLDAVVVVVMIIVVVVVVRAVVSMYTGF